MTRTTKAALATLALSVLAGAPARADWLQSHTYVAELPLRSVERPLVLGKGWVEFGVGFDAKRSTTYFLKDVGFWNGGFTEGTHFAPYGNNAVWTHGQLKIDFDWGFTKNSQLFIHTPIVFASLTNDNGADISAAGLGDVRLGITQQWHRRIDPKGRFNSSLASTLEVKTPTGNESPGSYLTSPGNITYVVLGTGTYDVALDLAYKQQLGPMALKFRAGYTLKFSGVVEYLIEDQEHQFNLRVDPGDEINFDLGVTAQLGSHVALTLGLDNTLRFKTREGPSSSGIDPCSGCTAIEGSDGISTDGSLRLQVSPSNRMQVDGFVAYTLAGRNSTFFWPLEDISPSRGVTAGGRVAVRF